MTTTFRSRALRTVLIIDDQFPTYADLYADGDELENFSERARAVELYRLFRQHHMPCDVENRLTEMAEEVERIRKSDLIVLDYHLTPNSTDSTKSISLVSKLADTPHFNTVVLYTLERDLVGVWLNLAAHLRRGWTDPGTILEANEQALEQWEELANQRIELPRPPQTLIASHILGGQAKWPREEKKSFRKELEALGVHPPNVNAFTQALIHREIRENLRVDPATHGNPQETVVGNFDAGGPLWLQARNCFVVILRKNDEQGEPTPPGRILECLDEALLNWQPNLLQVLVSEIQNILELESLAMEELGLLNTATQVGLL